MKKRFKIESVVFRAEEAAYSAGECAAAWLRHNIKGAFVLSVGLVVVAVFGGIAALCGFSRELFKGAR